MATIKFEGLEGYLKNMQQLQRAADKITKGALFDGAAILADAVQEEIRGLTRLDERQRRGLSEGLGVARFWDKAGMLMTKIGFEGYNSWRTKRWPNGQPNVMIARTTIRGTSWMPADRFTARAARKAKAACIAAMQKRVEQEIEAVTK